MQSESSCFLPNPCCTVAGCDIHGYLSQWSRQQYLSTLPTILATDAMAMLLLEPVAAAVGDYVTGSGGAKLWVLVGMELVTRLVPLPSLRARIRGLCDGCLTAQFARRTCLRVPQLWRRHSHTAAPFKTHHHGGVSPVIITSFYFS